MVLFLCFANVCHVHANAYEVDKARCQYDRKDTAPLNERVVLKSIKSPIDGIACFYHNNGNVYEVSFKDGKEEGIARTYYISGKLQDEVLFKRRQYIGRIAASLTLLAMTIKILRERLILSKRPGEAV